MFELPAGPINVSTLAERRRQHVESTYQTVPDFFDPSVTNISYLPMRTQDVNSAYIETLIPLVSGKNARPMVESLEAQLSVRHDRYTTNTVGLGGYYSSNITTRNIGNPNLQPEESKSLSAGIILTPGALPGQRLSIDYTQIKKSLEIRSLQQQEIINSEDELPGRVGRAPLTDPQRAAGYTVGLINFVDVSYLNTTNTIIDSYDIHGDYLWDALGGSLQVYAIATWQPHYKVRLSADSTLDETVGYQYGTLEWRGNAD